MVKLIGALASVFIGNYMSHSKPPSVLVMDFLASKSRVIILMIMACITLSTLFTAGVVLTILGASAWVNALDSQNLANGQFICYSGLGLLVFSLIVTLTVFNKSKSALEVQKVEEPKSSEHPVQDAILTLLAEMTKEKPSAEHSTHPTHEEASEIHQPPPAPVQARERLPESSVNHTH